MSGELVRAVARNSFVYILSGSWPREAKWTGVEGIEDPMARSDFTRGNTTGSASLPSAGSASLLALLRARRCFHGAERNFRISLLSRCRWWDDKSDGSFIASERQHVYHVAVDAQNTV